MMAGDIARVARAALEQGEAGLAQYDVQLFRPIQPMLAQSADDIPEALACIGEAALEYKMDGARVQVHKSGDDVVVYSRSLKDVTPAVPEVVELMRALPAKDLILDGEVISLLPDGRPQPFQITMRRFGRKLDVERMRAGAAHDALLVRPALSRTAALCLTSRKRGASPALSGLAPGLPDPAHGHRRRRGRATNFSNRRWRAATKASWPKRSTRNTPPERAAKAG